MHRLIFNNGFNEEDIIFASLGATSFPPPQKPSLELTPIKNLLLSRRKDELSRMIPNEIDQIIALRIISYYYFLVANIYPSKTNLCFPILDSLPFINNNYDLLKDVISPKHKELKEMKNYGLNYRKNVAFMTIIKESNQIYKRKMHNLQQVQSHLITKKDYYNSYLFRKYVLDSMNNESILIESLPSSEIRNFCIKIFSSFKNEEYNDQEYPKSLVTFLRHEFFLRDLC